MRVLTGDRYELTSGTTRAEVGALAAVLCALEVDGVRLTETVPRDGLPPHGCGIVLAPWPNRVRDGRWTLDGEVQQLDISEPATGNASHGLLRNTGYRVLDRADDTLVLGALIAPQHGWPFLIETSVHYVVSAYGLSVTHVARNLGDRPAPWAVGAHPYFRVGETPVEDLTVTVARGRRLELDDQLIPVATHPVDAEYDLRTPRRVGDLDLNTGYALAPDDEWNAEAARLTAPDGAAVSLWTDHAFGWIQAYTPRDFPRDGVAGQAIALEPMTAPPDALNSGEGLLWLEPGESTQAAWGATYHRAPAAAPAP